jgi:FlaA1/EpsC-like NDP-sugar epimerase
MVVGGSYLSMLKHFSGVDAIKLGVNSLFGWTLGYLLLMAFLERGASVGVGMIAPMASLLMMGSARVLYAHRTRSGRSARRRGNPRFVDEVDDRTAIVVYGAGNRGLALAQLFDHGFPEVQVAGFLDDNDKDLVGRTIGGLYAMCHFGQLWVTFEPNRFKLTRLRDWCESKDVQLVILPFSEPFLSLSS